MRISAMISLVAVVLSMANVVSSKKVRNSANNHVKPSLTQSWCSVSTLAINRKWFQKSSSPRRPSTPEENAASKAKHAEQEASMGGALLSSVSAHGCRAFRHMFVEWPRRHRFVGKLPMGAIRDRGGQGAAVRVEIVKD